MLLVSAPRSGVVGRVALDGDGTALDRLERILGAAVQPVRQPPSTPEPATTARPSATAPSSTSRPATTTKPATADRPVRVVLDATARPSFVCVETADGARVFAGVLAGRRTFSGAHLRVSIGLKTTRLTVDGRAVPIDGSPAAFDVTHHGATRLPGAQAPCG